MKVGDYVRAEDDLGVQLICKIKARFKDFCNTDEGYWDDDHIIKSSPNIIDLIEVGDYVNGNKIEIIDKPCKLNPYGSLKYRANDCYDFEQILGNEIKSIVTKEQFESMKYRIGELLYEGNRTFDKDSK